MQFAQYVGWLLTLATVIVAVGHITKALIVLVWKEASEFRQVSGDDAFRALIRMVADLLGLLRLRWLATVCSVATLSTSLMLDVDGYASFGFCVITFVITGVATPSALLFIRPFASNVLQRVTRKS